ncbi:MAG: PASTA domain-containing protein [bacterium]|nr:PASTA domain-containing protein [bacterium]
MKKKVLIIIGVIILLLFSLLIFMNFNKKDTNSNKTEVSEKTENVIKVPNMVGEEIGTAQEVLEKLGLEVTVKEKVSTDEDNIGKVYKQSVVGPIKNKQTITLYTYVSNEEVKVPSVIGMNKDEAKDVLTKLGFSVALEEKLSKEKEDNIVIKQEVNNNSKVVKGSLIKLVYAKKEIEEDKDANKNSQTTVKTEETNIANNNDNVNNNNNNSSNSNTNNGSNNNNSGVNNPTTPTPVTPKIRLTGGSDHYRKGYVAACFSYSITNGTGKEKVVWKSSNTSVASVDSRGCISPNAVYGKASISVTIEGTNVSDSTYIAVLGLKGDLNGDGMIDAIDAAIAMDYYGTRDEIILSVGDINKDGVINDYDSRAILNYFKNGDRW